MSVTFKISMLIANVLFNIFIGGKLVPEGN